MARYPNAIWQGASVSDYSSRYISPRFVCAHVAQGAASGTTSWFHNPISQVSAHFLNPKVGPMLQYVDTNEEAYAEMAYNGEMISVEHEGFSGEHLNANQKNNLRALLVWAKKVHSIAPIWRYDPYGAGGVVGHGELGYSGGDHPNCPGQPIIDDVRALCYELRPRFIGTRIPSAQQVAKAGLIALNDPAEANLALANGWTIWHWGGLRWRPSGQGTQLTTQLYASVNYQAPRT